ncbi:uncharacterized protein [Drosophila virilis]|uniref:Myb/SANT-like DNA-binding domain-containing protein n=1 Tax=Drosophila virilis TaxID=7244 RepID=B4M0Y6_DROVI|nr:uncharacterized protein Dvir_GJ23098 [Drosophila virilis]
MSKPTGIKRKRPTKWTSRQSKKLLNFLRKNPYEQPNSFDFYRKLSKTFMFDFEANVIRSKVKQIVKAYKNAKTLIDVNTNFPMSEVLEICPQYKELHDIFDKSPQLNRNAPMSEIPEGGNMEMPETKQITQPEDTTSIEIGKQPEEHLTGKLDAAKEVRIHRKSLSQQDIRLLELHLREKELDLKYFEIQTKERLARLQIESRERIAMRKLELRYRNSIN